VGLEQGVSDIGHQRPQLLGGSHRGVEHRLPGQRLRVQHAVSSALCRATSSRQLGLEALRVLEVLHAQRAARHLVLVGRPDALAGGADLAAAAAFAQRLAGTIELDVERQDQRTGLGQEQPRAHLDAELLDAFDLQQQVRGIDHHAVAM